MVFGISRRRARASSSGGEPSSGRRARADSDLGTPLTGLRFLGSTALGPPGGGVIPDTPLLRDIVQHPIQRAYRGEYIDPKGQRFRGNWLTAYDIYSGADVRYKTWLESSAFSSFVKIPGVQVPHALVTALMERWFHQTNTVHLPDVEIGPTAADWYAITGIAFGGAPVSYSHCSSERAARLLGAGKVVGRDQLSLAALGEGLTTVPSSASELDLDRGRRCLVLHSLFQTVFAGTKSTISCDFASLVEDEATFQSFNWGAASFSHFLYSLRQVTSNSRKTLTGFWPFMHFWGMETLRLLNAEAPLTFPRARRWVHRLNGRNFPSIADCRGALDNSTKDTVIRDSYNDIDPMLMSMASIDAPFRRSYQGLYSWEMTLGERNWFRATGELCVPRQPPATMYGDSGAPVSENVTSRDFLDTSINHRAWFAAHSIGRLRRDRLSPEELELRAAEQAFEEARDRVRRATEARARALAATGGASSSGTAGSNGIDDLPTLESMMARDDLFPAPDSGFSFGDMMASYRRPSPRDDMPSNQYDSPCDWFSDL